MATDTFAGPVDYLVFEFADDADIWPGLRAVLARVEQGIIEVLDLEIVQRGADGTPVCRAVTDLVGASEDDIATFTGAQSDILEPDDLEIVAEALEEGRTALVIIYEDRSLAAAAQAWTAVGGTELFAGGVDIADLAQLIESEDAA